MLATLNHPHIGAIYGLEDADGVRALVLELVEGETLAERIARQRVRPAACHSRTPLPSHGRSPTRSTRPTPRDRSPRSEAREYQDHARRVVKVLDFGLAKAAFTDASPPDQLESRAGVILGTAAYMSPEQARGLSVDKRGDIWAFGCVLFEMLSGHVAFRGDTASDTIAKILEREPDWSLLPVPTPVFIRRLLRCLTKDPKQRQRDIGDVRIELSAIDEMLPAGSDKTAASTTPAKIRTAWLPWVGLAALATCWR